MEETAIVPSARMRRLVYRMHVNDVKKKKCARIFFGTCWEINNFAQEKQTAAVRLESIALIYVYIHTII